MKRLKSNWYRYLVVVILGVILGVSVVQSAALAQDEVFKRNFFADIASEVDSAVVKINAKIKVDSEDLKDHPLYKDPFFRRFFEEQPPFDKQNPQLRQGFGTGFIISEDGYILTNEHVIHQADEVTVKLSDRKEPVNAEVIGSDYSLDLAVLKIDVNHDLPTVELGDSDQIQPGDWSIAIGNPYELNHTVTVGVISALGRPLKVRQGERPRVYKNMIQTDAAINPGNSGGPLLNIEGEVIGINTAINAQAQGIGFAIPINEVKQVLDELKEQGKVIRPWMGVYMQSVTKEIADYFDLETEQGALIADVMPNSPASEAGLQAGDVIIEANKQEINSPQEVVDLVNDSQVGQRLVLRIIRDNRKRFVTLRLDERPNEY
ncbi:MAG: S1C family serine protease [Bacillota bacterium]